MNPPPTPTPFHPKASNLSLVGAATSIICVAMKVLLQQNTSFVAKKYFCHDKHVFVATELLSWQIFVATNTCYDKNFSLLRQTLCHNKTFVTTSILLSWQKMCLLWQKYVCHNKNTFVVTKDMFCYANMRLSWQKLLSQQKWCMWQLPPMIVTNQTTYEPTNPACSQYS